jgi:hypothetical protein
MAKQTINIGTAPNDGTGTPLRTAFDYCNLNFTELYTAVGPSGNNIVVPGTATITGNLTVDTNTLFVDAANNRVGIGTVSPTAPLHILAPGSDSAAIRLAATGGRVFDIGSTGAGYGSANNLIIYDITGSAERWRLDATGIHTWSNVGGVAGTAMTLNSTGLGLGVVPSTAGVRLHARDTTTEVYGMLQNGGTLAAGRTSQLWLGNGPTISSAGSRDWRFTNTGISATAADWTLDYWNGTNVVERIRVDSGGNLGMNVTPRPWAGDYRAVQVAGITALWGNASISVFSSNIYWDGSIRYIAAQVGSFLQLSGKQLLFNQSTDASPAAGGVAAYSEVFKIDTNGNPIFIPSNTPATLTTNGQLTVNATSNTNLRFSYRGSDGTTRVANITLA